MEHSTLYLALYGNILRPLVVVWIYKDSLNLKAVEIKRFVSYFSNFTRECLGSVYCVRCGFRRDSVCDCVLIFIINTVRIGIFVVV